MTWPAPDRRDRLVWSDTSRRINWHHCACAKQFAKQGTALTHASRCPVVAKRRRFYEIRAQREVSCP